MGKKQDFKEIVIQAIIMHEKKINAAEARKIENFNEYHVFYREFIIFLKTIYKMDIGKDFNADNLSNISYNLLIKSLNKSYKKFDYPKIMYWSKRETYSDFYHIKESGDTISDEIEYLRGMRNIMFEIYMEEDKGHVESFILKHNRNMNDLYNLLENELVIYNLKFENKKVFDDSNAKLHIMPQDMAALRQYVDKLKNEEKTTVGKGYKEIKEKILESEKRLVSLLRKGENSSSIQEMKEDIKKREKEYIKERIRGRIQNPSFEKLLAESMRQNQKVGSDFDTPYEAEMYKRCMKKFKSGYNKSKEIEEVLKTKAENAIVRIISNTKKEIQNEYID